MDGKWPFELKLAGTLLIIVFVSLIIGNFFSNINFVSSNKTYEEDIKTTIEFTNSNDKLDIDVGYAPIADEHKKSIIIGIVALIIIILLNIFLTKGLGEYAIISCCLIFIMCTISVNSCEKVAYKYVYELVKDIDYSKDIYLKTYEDNIEITYLTKEDNSYKTKSFANLINECKYIEGDNFKLTLTNNKPNGITLYIPVKYNQNYSQLIE